MPGPITNFYQANGAKLSEVLILLHKMETRIWNKTRIWNTFAGDQVIFHIRVYTVFSQIRSAIFYNICTFFSFGDPILIGQSQFGRMSSLQDTVLGFLANGQT